MEEERKNALILLKTKNTIMKKILIILLCLPMIGFGQQTYVPDDNFEQALINLGYDTILDNYVLTSNINSITDLNVNNSNISDMTGIADFTALTQLYCGLNNLTTLDVNSNLNLTVLGCEYNQLTNLSFDLISNLEQLNCIGNLLTSLDLSNQTKLHFLLCSDNNLSSLDMRNGNNHVMKPWNEAGVTHTPFGVLSNPDLTCIDVDNTWFSNNWWSPYCDNQANFSYDCLINSIEDINTYKALKKITNVLGEEISVITNTPLFYIYDDGTVEKKIIIE